MSTLLAAAAVIVAALAALLTWTQQNRLNGTQDRIAELQRTYLDVSQRLADVETERRRDELTPKITMTLKRSSSNAPSGRNPRFALRCDGPLDYDRMVVDLVEAPPLIVGFAPDSSRTMDVGAVTLGASVELPLIEDTRQRGGPVRALVTCERGEDSWRVVVDFDAGGYARVYRAR